MVNAGLTLFIIRSEQIADLLEQTKNIKINTILLKGITYWDASIVISSESGLLSQCSSLRQLFILVHYTHIWRFKRPICSHFFMHPKLTLLNEQSLLIRLLKHAGRSLTFPVVRSNTSLNSAKKQYDPY